jgi:hypothetical protein
VAEIDTDAQFDADVRPEKVVITATSRHGAYFSAAAEPAAERRIATEGHSDDDEA